MIIEKALTASRAREAARRARENIRRKNGLEGFNMPDKLCATNNRGNKTSKKARTKITNSI